MIVRIVLPDDPQNELGERIPLLNTALNLAIRAAYVKSEYLLSRLGCRS